MPLDGFTLNLLIRELKNEIIGCRIEKIHQPSNDEIVFHLRSRQGAKKLYISASSGTPRLNLTENAPENPAVPPMMCMFLRKHLTGCIITDLSQDGLDRTLFFELNGTNEIGGVSGNYNYQSATPNGWPSERIKNGVRKWLHSDIRDVAFHYVFPLFQYITR